MRRTKTLLILPLAGLIAACANSGANYVPVIDGPVGPNYSADLAQCQSLAAQQGTFDSTTGERALAGAGVAAAGTAIVSNTGTNVRDAAVIGALAGATSGALQQQSNKEAIIRNCMRSRGHNVVG